MNEHLTDFATEHLVLSKLYHGGHEAYLDIVDFLDAETFTDMANKAIYRCIQHLVEEKNAEKFDQPSIIAAINELGFNWIFENKDDLKHLQTIFASHTNSGGVRVWAAKLRKLQIARMLIDQLQDAEKNIEGIKGNESVAHILGIAENAIFDFSSLLHSTTDGDPENIAEGIEEYLSSIEANPSDIVGISSGMSYYDQAIGGGFRPGTVSLIGARPKALVYGSMVYTPDGARKIEDVKIGDKILHPYQGQTTVKNVYDHQDVQSYNVIFDDGSYVGCCGEHLWAVNQLDYKSKTTQHLTTSQLLTAGLSFDTNKGSQYRWAIPLTNPLEFDKQELGFSPYEIGKTFKDISPKRLMRNFHKLLFNSVENRLEFIRGIIDGYCQFFKDKNKPVWKANLVVNDYNTCYMIRVIAESLGGKGEITFADDDEICLSLYFKHDIKPREKPARYAQHLKNVYKKIVDIVPGTKCNARCIQVEADDGLFITDYFTVTHNTGKTMLAMNIGLHIAKNVGIPVLYLDTEMTKIDHWGRLLPCYLSENGVNITINELESGQYSYSEFKKTQVKEAAKAMQDMPLYYRNISGMPFEETMSIMRRWIHKVVGFGDDGKANDCIIIYDYLKLMNSNEISKQLQEYQALGFMTTSMHNFAVRYNVPILSFAQLNRDGINSEETNVISGSDRIMWLVTNFTIFKSKTEEELAGGAQHGNRKLVPVAARHGEGLPFGDYINVTFDGKHARVIEGETKYNLAKQCKEKKKDNDEKKPDDET